MSIFANDAYDGHELVAFGNDRQSGLRAIIAVHDTTLGQGVGHMGYQLARETINLAVEARQLARAS